MAQTLLWLDKPKMAYHSLKHLKHHSQWVRERGEARRKEREKKSFSFFSHFFPAYSSEWSSAVQAGNALPSVVLVVSIKFDRMTCQVVGGHRHLALMYPYGKCFSSAVAELDGTEMLGHDHLKLGIAWQDEKILTGKGALLQTSLMSPTNDMTKQTSISNDYCFCIHLTIQSQLVSWRTHELKIWTFTDF